MNALTSPIDLLEFREPTVLDAPFIISSWVMTAPKPAGAPVGPWRRNMRRVCGEMLAKARVVIACDRNHEGTIHAWAAGVPGCVFWAFARPELRGYGIGRALMQKVSE